MNEVLGDADPPARGGRPLDDDRPAFDDLHDRYGEFGDGFEAEPGPLRRFVAKVATPEALAIAAIVVATASLLDIPAVGDTVNLLSVSRGFDAAFLGRVNAAGQFVVAAIGFGLALTARRRRPRDDEPDVPIATWVPPVSGGALIIATVSALLAIVAFLVAGAAHQPSDSGFQSVTSVPPQVTVSAEPAPIIDQGNPAPLPGLDPTAPPFSSNLVIVDPSTGAVFTVSPAPAPPS